MIAADRADARSATKDPRILVFSTRHAESRKWQAPRYEFEDVAAQVDAVDLLAPPARQPTPVTRISNRVARLTRHVERAVDLTVRPTTVDRDYELFFATLSFPSDATHLLQLKRWRERCGKAICFIGELFTEQLEEAQPYLELLRRFRFDHVFLFNPRPAQAVAQITGAQVDFLPFGVDAFRFAPAPDGPPRSVDLYQFGRRSPTTHAAALDLAKRDGLFYVYDTTFNVPLPDYRAHRSLIAEVMKRSRYFFSYRPGEDLGRGTGDDVLSTRYFEATAGGAVALGSSPKSLEYQQCFGWPDATIEIPYDAQDLRCILAELDSQPQRLAQVRIDNVVNSLRRHDWLHRWARVLDAAEMPHTAEMQQRREQLEALAVAFEQHVDH